MTYKNAIFTIIFTIISFCLDGMYIKTNHVRKRARTAAQQRRKSEESMSISPEQQEFVMPNSPINPIQATISELLSNPEMAKNIKLAVIAQEREKLIKSMEQESIQNPYERFYALVVLEKNL